MKMVRDSLGEDAVIVATREENGGKSVRVTAAVEQPDDEYDMAVMDRAPARAGASGAARSGYASVSAGRDAENGAGRAAQKAVPVNYGDRWDEEDTESDEEAVVEILTDAMLRHAVPEEITDQVISCAAVLGVNDAGIALTAAIEHLYAFRSLPGAPGKGKAIMLVGPPGAGKTLTIAKLSARAVMAGQTTGVITTDTQRAGGVEQLSAFTKLLRAPLHKAKSATDLRRAIGELSGMDNILIDTAGMNPFSPEEMRDLARLVSAGDIEPVLVMPAGIDAQESGEIARIYATLGVHYMMPTRLDIARRLGGLLSAAHYGGLFFADASNTPQVADGLIGLSPEKLADFLMPGAAKTARTRTETRKQTVSAG